MKYARIDPATQAVTIIEIDPAIYHDLVATQNPKVAYLRPLVTDVPPVPGAAQYVKLGPILIEPTQARQTWLLAEKPASQIADEARGAELPQLKAAINALQSGSGTVAERLVRVEKVCAWLLKGYA